MGARRTSPSWMTAAGSSRGAGSPRAGWSGRTNCPHLGVDPIGLARAALQNMLAGHVVQGGSTITQQLAKNLFLDPGRTFDRKMQEAMLALYLESRYSKNQILTLYLNRVYFGAGVFGIEAASQKFFGRPATELTLSEAAILAGSVKAPAKY